MRGDTWHWTVYIWKSRGDHFWKNCSKQAEVMVPLGKSIRVWLGFGPLFGHFFWQNCELFWWCGYLVIWPKWRLRAPAVHGVSSFNEFLIQNIVLNNTRSWCWFKRAVARPILGEHGSPSGNPPIYLCGFIILNAVPFISTPFKVYVDNTHHSLFRNTLKCVMWNTVLANNDRNRNYTTWKKQTHQNSHCALGGTDISIILLLVLAAAGEKMRKCPGKWQILINNNWSPVDNNSCWAVF